MNANLKTLIANAAIGNTVVTNNTMEVVANENETVKVKNANIASDLVVVMDNLAQARVGFEAAEYATSNARLYDILGQIYAQYLRVREPKSLLAATVKALKAKLIEKGVNMNGTTLAVSLFVRYVFSNTGRQRIQNYTRTIQAAVANNVAPADFADFVNREGGVEACKKAFVKSSKVITKEQIIAANMPAVEQLLANQVESPIAMFEIGEGFFGELDDEQFTILLGKASKDGNVQVLLPVPVQAKGVTKWAKQQLAIYIASQNAQIGTPLPAQQVTAELAANETLSDLEKLSA